MLSPTLNLWIEIQDHLDLFVIMNVETKSEWLKCDQADCLKLSSHFKYFVLANLTHQISLMKLYT